MKILIAEDDFTTGEFYRILFRDDDITLCIDGDELIMKYEETYDLILLDIRMPNKNGIEVLQFLESINNKVPVVIITAINITEYIREATKQALLLQKPVEGNLRDKLVKYLENV